MFVYVKNVLLLASQEFNDAAVKIFSHNCQPDLFRAWVTIIERQDSFRREAANARLQKFSDSTLKIQLSRSDFESKSGSAIDKPKIAHRMTDNRKRFPKNVFHRHFPYSSKNYILTPAKRRLRYPVKPRTIHAISMLLD